MQCVSLRHACRASNNTDLLLKNLKKKKKKKILKLGNITIHSLLWVDIQVEIVFQQINIHNTH